MSNDKFPAFSVLMTVYEKEKPSFLDGTESCQGNTLEI